MNSVGHLEPPDIEVRIDVYLRHVVDDHGNASPLTIGENMIERRRLARAQKAGQYRDREPIVSEAIFYP